MTARTQGHARVFAPATVGNVGPGFDVLGLAVDGLGDHVEVTLGVSETAVVLSGRDIEALPLDPGKNAAAIAARAYLAAAKHKGHALVSVHKGLPVSGGLGGSAASSVAGALAAALALGKPYTDAAVLAAAVEGEAAVAGRHYDNLAPCYFGGLTLVLPSPGSAAPHIMRLHLRGSYWLALASPHVRVETKAARAVLPTMLQRELFITQMARTAALVAAFASADHQALGAALRDDFAEAARAGLIPHFRDAQAAALKAGALGCSISGAGPTTFALCADEATAHKAARAMARAYAGVGVSIHVGKLSKRGARKRGR